MSDRKIIVGVVGSGAEPHEELSRPLGRWIAKKGFHLVNGGGGGVMESVAKAFAETPGRAGLALGVVPADGPCDSEAARKKRQSPPGYPNPFIDLPIQTHLYQSGIHGKEITSRNHIVVLTADVVVALPGGPGTRSEIQLALEYGKPLIVLSPKSEWKEFENTSAVMAKRVEEVFTEIDKLINS